MELRGLTTEITREWGNWIREGLYGFYISPVPGFCIGQISGRSRFIEASEEVGTSVVDPRRWEHPHWGSIHNEHDEWKNLSVSCSDVLLCGDCKVYHSPGSSFRASPPYVAHGRFPWKEPCYSKSSGIYNVFSSIGQHLYVDNTFDCLNHYSLVQVGPFFGMRFSGRPERRRRPTHEPNAPLHITVVQCDGFHLFRSNTTSPRSASLA
jgi:hypothetical protein